MADARALLKAQRTTRRIDHPHALYAESGKLSCSLCHVAIKTDSLWPSHLKSPQHAKQLQTDTATRLNAKKRKADSDPDDDFEDARKKTRTPDDGLGVVDQDDEDDPTSTVHDAVESTPRATNDVRSTANQPTTEEQEEFLAFQRELDADEAISSVPTALAAAPTISAAPVTIAELAAQARQDLSTQKDTKAEILEAEKDDAARVLQDEFDQMEELEARLQKLREKRELLRHAQAPPDQQPLAMTTEPVRKAQGTLDNNGVVDDDHNDDDDEDEFDDWHFGAT